MKRKLLIAVPSLGVLFFSLFLFLVFSYLLIFSPGIIRSPATIQGQTGNKQTQLPYEQQAKPGPFQFRTVIQDFQFETGLLRITPDDCVESLSINDASIPLPASRDQQCDYQNGFVVDVGPYLKTGSNILLFTITNKGGPVGLRLENAMQPWAYMTLRAGFMISAITFIWIVMAWFGAPLLQRYLLATGMAVSCAYFFTANPITRGNDVAGHLAHFAQVKSGNIMPKTRDCWECHQPPVYYWTAALASRPFELKSPAPPKFYQWLSLNFYFVFLCTSLLLINRVLPKGKGWLTASMLVIFWPAGFLRGSAIGNDVMLSMFAALLFYFLHEWLQTRNQKHINVASMFFLLAVLTKFSGLMLSIPCLGALIYVARERRAGFHFRDFFVPVYRGLTAVALCFILIQIKGDIAHQLSTKVLPQGMILENSLRNFVSFDLVDYFSRPYSSIFDNSNGRQFFWNFLAKSSLFGEFQFSRVNGFLSAAAHTISALLLAIIAGAILGFLAKPAENFKRTAPSLVLLAMVITALMGYRFNTPVAAAGDFRYVHFAIIPFSILIGQIYDLCEIKLLRRWLLIASIGFCTASAIFYGYVGLFS